MENPTGAKAEAEMLQGRWGFPGGPRSQREAVVITKRQLRGKGHGGILACLRHLL